MYKDPAIARQIARDYEKAPIPETHKAAIRWVEKFVRCSWEMAPAEIEAARATGVTDADIVDWAQMAALQTYFVIQADGAGIPLFQDTATGPVLGRDRESYHSAPAGLLAGAPSGMPAAAARHASGESICWVDVNPSSEQFKGAAAAARERWGVAPNLLTAVSCGRSPDLTPRVQMALELLESPQSGSLSPRLHALVRALVTSLDRCAYSQATVRQLLLDAGGDPETYKRVTADYTQCEWSPTDRLVLDFAAKVARNAYKITETDAEMFRNAGLDEEAYVDVMCTAAIQLGIDRMANSLGVSPDSRPLLSPRA